MFLTEILSDTEGLAQLKHFQMNQYLIESAQLTEHAEAIVHGDHNDVSIGCKDTAIKHVSWALHVGASMDEQHHRLLAAITNICTAQTMKSVVFLVRPYGDFSTNTTVKRPYLSWVSTSNKWFTQLKLKALHVDCSSLLRSMSSFFIISAANDFIRKKRILGMKHSQWTSFKLAVSVSCLLHWAFFIYIVCFLLCPGWWWFLSPLLFPSMCKTNGAASSQALSVIAISVPVSVLLWFTLSACIPPPPA